MYYSSSFSSYFLSDFAPESFVPGVGGAGRGQGRIRLEETWGEGRGAGPSI